MVLRIGSGDVDDLSTLNVLDEESLLRELRARYKKGVIYVSCLRFLSFFIQIFSIYRLILEMYLLQ